MLFSERISAFLFLFMRGFGFGLVANAKLNLTARILSLAKTTILAPGWPYKTMGASYI